jgi:hypothetical protein
VSVSPKGVVGDLSYTNKLSASITPAAGTFSGSVTETNVAGRPVIKFSGAIQQKWNTGYGLFTNTNQTGAVLFEATLSP